ncbi:hypothetical protein BH11BAC2_BH11BAC2_16620 [soil metagenome]
MKKLLLYIFPIAFLWMISSCEKDISVDLPRPESKVVVDGYVEAGLPPYILLSRNAGYFDPIDTAALNNNSETGAVIIISDGITTETMTEIDTVIDGNVVKGIYTALGMIGTPGRTYTIDITTLKGEKLSSSTKLDLPVSLDSTWFKIQDGKDSLGFVWANLDDPDSLNNCYRWFAKRIGKDDFFIAPFGSTFEDKFINGKKFDFAYNRGMIANSDAEDDNNDEAGFFKKGDTIVVKFCSVDRSTFEFWRDAENQIGNNGSPFAVPSNIKSNIKGGLGLFASYTATYDTVYAPL